MINPSKIALSVGVGVADEVLEGWDKKEGRTGSFQTSQDIGRLVGAGLGYLIELFWFRYARYGEALALSETPLLVKSIAKSIKSVKMAPPASTFVPRRQASPVSRSMGHEVPSVISID